jgi:enamine deaminase RidA (YjgF/YER057c/UK114 family)
LGLPFPDNPPPSSWIIVSGLSLPEWLIEIEAEAVLAD